MASFFLAQTYMFLPMRYSIRLLAAAFFLPVAALAEFSFDFETGGFVAGRADVRIPNPAGTPFSLTDDLRADDPAAFFRARATWHINPRHDISVLYAPLSIDSSGSFGRTTQFAGTDFLANTPTSARFRFDSYRLTYRYNFIRTDDITFGLGLTAKIRDAEVRVSQPERSAFDDDTGLVPLINYQFAWRFSPSFSFFTEGDALGAPQGYAIDAMAAIQWHVTDQLALRLGYRILDGGADNDTVYTLSTFHYAVIGATFTF